MSIVRLDLNQRPAKLDPDRAREAIFTAAAPVSTEQRQSFAAALSHHRAALGLDQGQAAKPGLQRQAISAALQNCGVLRLARITYTQRPATSRAAGRRRAESLDAIKTALDLPLDDLLERLAARAPPVLAQGRSRE